MDTQRNNSSTKRLEITSTEKDELIQKYMGLVISISTKYRERYSYISYEIGDLINEGIFILLTINSKYDKNKGKFSTFLQISILNHFKSITRKERTRQLEYVENLESYENSNKNNKSNNNTIEPIFLNLSKQAKMFVKIALETPIELCNIIDNAAKTKRYHFIIGEYLGFTRKVVKKIREEIIKQLI